VAPSSRSVDSGSTTSFTVTPAFGYSRDTIVEGTCPVGSWSGNTYTIGSVTGNCSVSFNFEMISETTNSIGMTFVRINPGTFWMGSPTDEPGRYSDETRHQVTLTNGYYLQTTEVTQGQWKAVMGSNPSHFSSCGEDCPVEKVSWTDVQEFISALNTLEGTTKYRLPTEAEWEYAARAGSMTAFANGEITKTDCDHDPNLAVMGWYCGNSGDTTHPVAQKQANAWGLYDMHGNVREWCSDLDGSYPSSAVTDPTGPSSGSDRVCRGGGYLNYARVCRSAHRYSHSPGDSYSDLGFRLARAL
jgi:formylglycine-generating enzyme required for sulfatase activity